MQLEAWLHVKDPTRFEQATAESLELPPDLHVPEPAEQASDVLERHVSFAFRCLRYLGVRAAELDDALVDLFAVVYQHLNELDGPYPRGWLYSECRRTAEDRAARFVPTLAHAASDRALAFGEQLLCVLPLEQREVFVLYEVENMPVREIALALALSERAVRARLHAARVRVVGEVERIAAGQS